MIRVLLVLLLILAACSPTSVEVGEPINLNSNLTGTPFTQVVDGRTVQVPPEYGFTAKGLPPFSYERAEGYVWELDWLAGEWCFTQDNVGVELGRKHILVVRYDSDLIPANFDTGNIVWKGVAGNIELPAWEVAPHERLAAAVWVFQPFSDTINIKACLQINWAIFTDATVVIRSIEVSPVSANYGS